MKSYTDIEQSKKLAEILPVESADMSYDWAVVGKEYSTIPYCRKPIDDELPCWSLSALLKVLPEPTLTNTNSIWKCTLSYKWGNSYFEKGKIQKTVSSKEPIDACYEMILQLGPNLLSKLKL